MKKLTKIFLVMLFVLILTVIMILSTTACGAKKEQFSLYEQGLEVVALMDEMADSQSYVQMFTGNTQISEVIQSNTNGDYSEPLEVYEVVLHNENFQGLLGNDETQASMSDELKEIISKKVNASVITQLNAHGGSENLAASAICTAEISFVNSEVKEDVIYIYVYENTAPVAVIFLQEGNDIVSANGTFMFGEEFINLTEESISELFEGLYETIKKVDIVRKK